MTDNPGLVLACGSDQLAVSGWSAEPHVTFTFFDDKWGPHRPRFATGHGLTDIRRLHSWLGNYIEEHS